MSDSESDTKIINKDDVNKSDSDCDDDDIHNEKVLNEHLKENADDESDSDNEDPDSKPGNVKVVNTDEAEEDRRKKLEAIKLEREADAPKTIFVGNLAITAKKNQLLKFFQKHGSIKSVRLRTDDGKKITHQKQIKQLPSLNGYVVFNKESSAQKSLEDNGKLFKGKHLRVNMANEKNYENQGKTVLFIGNLKYSATDEDLHEIFSACGEIDYVRTLRNEHGCKGIAYVGFKTADAVHLGLELNGTMLDNRPIRVERYVPNKKQKDQKKNKRLEKKMNGKGKFSKNKQETRSQNSNPPAKKSKNNTQSRSAENDKIEKKPKDKKAFEGKKAERSKKKHKLGQGERQKRALAKKIAPRAVT